MSSPFRIFLRPWIAVPLLALGFLAWTDGTRMREVERLSDTRDWSVDPLVTDDASPTGYAGGLRKLIVPGHDNYSYQWIEQTQQMFAKGELRVRRVAFENAPFGREVIAPSPYRWWLGLVAFLDHALTGRSLGLAVEHAALYADPVLHALLLLGTAAFAAVQFGELTAALLAVGIAALFPFGGGFLPGVPDDHGMEQAFALWSVLPLLAGARAGDAKVARRWFVLAGVAGGIGLWLSVINQMPVIAGIVLAALPAAIIGGTATRPPWRAWAAGGAATTLAAYAIDYLPAHAGPSLEVVNPLLALAWLAGGEVISFATGLVRGHASDEGPASGRAGTRRIAIAALAAAVVAGFALTVALRPHRMVFDMDPMATRLTNVANASVVANSLSAWEARDGLSTTLKAACLPALLILPAAVLLLRRRTDARRRTMLALALGPVAVALAYSCRQLHMWNVFDGALLVLLAGATASLPGLAPWKPGRLAWSCAVIFAMLPGLTQLLPPLGAAANNLGEIDAQSLIERDVAHWLAKQSNTSGAVVLAAPNLTATLCYHGGLGGIGTFNWENLDGIKGSIRIAAATEPEEAFALVKGRRVEYIVVPSWDMFLDKFAGAGLGLAPDTTKGIERSFVGGMLAKTQLPPWIELIPYQLPSSALGPDKWVMIFKVVEDQEPAVAYSRIAEYFIQMNTVDRAEILAKRLRRYPSKPVRPGGEGECRDRTRRRRRVPGCVQDAAFLPLQGSRPRHALGSPGQPRDRPGQRQPGRSRKRTGPALPRRTG